MNRLKNQNGAVLVVTLVMLLLLTFIGLDSMKNISLEEGMAINFQDTQKSFQNAEAALLTAENIISDKKIISDGSAATSLTNFITNTCVQDVVVANMQSTIDNLDWTSSNACCVSAPATCPTNEARFIILVDTATSKTTFHIYGRGFGNTGQTKIVLKSVFRSKVDP
ncbi:MAG: hypothetical protein HQL46_10560 [Gammaproteobacteria bacterium]|nr:hypothetical protein [Gammaproteobacteria bacterium]